MATHQTARRPSALVAGSRWLGRAFRDQSVENRRRLGCDVEHDNRAWCQSSAIRRQDNGRDRSTTAQLAWHGQLPDVSDGVGSTLVAMLEARIRAGSCMPGVIDVNSVDVQRLAGSE